MNKEELKLCLALEKKNNIGNIATWHVWFVRLTQYPSYLRWKYIKHFRKALYYEKLLHRSKAKYIIPFLIESRLRNLLGNKLGFEIVSCSIGPGLTIYHNGPVVINNNSKIGSNCRLHGDNCIGNDGINDACPVIGDNVEIGVGAKIIGGVKIGNNIKIGAGAVVVSDFLQDGSIIGGVPARKIK